MIWFSSDPHHDHFNIISFCSRPFKDLFHMREELINRHNEVVGENDIVYHLGDFSMKHTSVPYILQRLKGVHILAAGNHCRVFRQEKYIDVYKEYGFAEVHREPFTKYFKELGQEVLLSHLPYRDSQNERFHSKRPINEGLLHFHGHRHSKPENVLNKKTRELDCGVDGHNYYPWSILEIKELLLKEGIIS